MSDVEITKQKALTRSGVYVSSFLHPHIHDRTVVQRDFTDLVKFTAFVYCQSKVQKKGHKTGRNKSTHISHM